MLIIQLRTLTITISLYPEPNGHCARIHVSGRSDWVQVDRDITSIAPRVDAGSGEKFAYISEDIYFLPTLAVQGEYLSDILERLSIISKPLNRFKYITEGYVLTKMLLPNLKYEDIPECKHESR